AELEAVILRALEKAPASRFASATEMRRALAAAVTDVPQLALASLALPPEVAAAVKQPSDPFAPTAAGTQESLARGETMPSPPPARDDVPVPQPVPPPVPKPRVTPDAPAPLAAKQATAATDDVPRTDLPAPLQIANPRAFDPFNYYATAKAQAEKLGGKVYLV